MYPEWRGMFGSHDDFFPKGIKQETKDVNHAEDWLPPNRSKELAEFNKFINEKVRPAKGAGDPCYTTLPWLKPTKTQEVPKDFALWPYGTTNGSARKRVYATRPNLKFTEIMSKLLARQNFRKLKEDPKFADVASLLAVEAASCTDVDPSLTDVRDPLLKKSELDRMLSAYFPNSTYKRPSDDQAASVELRGYSYSHHDPRHSSSRAQALFDVWQALGGNGGEWTLTPFEYEQPQFETGAGPGDNRFFPADLPLTAYAQYEIIKYAVDQIKDPQLKAYFSRATGESDDFGKHFQCIDELAGPVVFRDETSWKNLCSALISRSKTLASLAGGSRGSRDVVRPPGAGGRSTVPAIKRFNPKEERLEDYLKRTNADLRKRKKFAY